MDHYFIFVYEDSLSIEDQRLFVDHVKSLLPTEDEICYCQDLASQIGSVLNRKLTYIANLDISSPKFMMCSWTNFQDIGTHSNFFPPYLSENDRCDHHTLEHETSLYLSEAIHALADQLPQNGTYHLDLLLSSGILEDLEISHHLDLAGAFHRLSVWHHASFSIICQSIPQNDAFQEWFMMINIQVISKNEARNVVLWRGSLSMKQEEVTECEYLKWLQLTLDPETSKRWLTLKDVLSIKSKHAKKDGAVLLSPEIEFLDQCCVSTIPSYMFSPVNFTLTVTGKDAENEDTYNLLRYLNTNSKVGLVLRLKYSVLKRSLPSVNFCNVREWKKAVADGNIQLPKCNLEADEEHVIFIANQHRNLPNAVSVYLLNDLSQLNSKISYDILATDSLYKSKLLKISSKKCEAALNGLPHCTSRRAFINYLDILGEFQVESITAYTRQLKEKNSGKETELNIQEIQLIFNFIEDWLISHLEQGKDVPPDEKFLRLDPNEMDSWDWPERLQLLRKQIEADKKAEHLSQSIIVSPQKKTTIITAKDMGRFFNEFGEASAITEAESISIKKKILYGNYEADGIQEPWPDVLRKAYHGVFYNCSQATEEEEISRAKLKDSLVVYETASTCSNSQLAPNYTILPLQGKNNKKYSSHSPLETNAKKSLSPKNRKTRASNSQKKTGRQQQGSSTDTQNFLQSRRKNFIPVRRSPRKRPVPTPATSKRRKNVEKVEYLSEKHKMKLREAVVIALEKHGIDLDHSMFKPCARKLFAVCKPFIKDIIGKGSTSSQMQRIAAAHVKQVMEFEMQKN